MRVLLRLLAAPFNVQIEEVADDSPGEGGRARRVDRRCQVLTALAARFVTVGVREEHVAGGRRRGRSPRCWCAGGFRACRAAAVGGGRLVLA